jgi:hypothetical protein
MLLLFTGSCHPDDEGAVLPKCRFLQEPYGITSQKTAFLNQNVDLMTDFIMKFYIYMAEMHCMGNYSVCCFDHAILT